MDFKTFDEATEALGLPPIREWTVVARIRLPDPPVLEEPEQSEQSEAE